MAKEYAERFYNSRAWRRCRASFVAHRVMIDGGECQRCRDCPGYIVHHRKPITPDNINDPEITLNENNLEFLCHACHEKAHGRFVFSGVAFDGNGDPLPPHDRRRLEGENTGGRPSKKYAGRL